MAEVIQAMQNQYARTGTYKIEDLRYVLGDPMRMVSVKPESGYNMRFVNKK